MQIFRRVALEQKARFDYPIQNHYTSPEELLQWLNTNCQWAVLDKSYKGISEEVNKDSTIFYNNWQLLSPAEFEVQKRGVCWDFIQYEYVVFREQLRYTFTKGPLTDGMFSLHYMYYDDKDGDQPSHTWLAYCKKGRVYILESSWGPKRGIHTFKSETEMLDTYFKWHNPDKYMIHAYKIDPETDKVNCNLFMKHATKYGKEISIKQIRNKIGKYEITKISL